MPTNLVETPDDKVFFSNAKWDPKVRTRITMERAVVRHACKTLIAHDAGFALRLHDGEDFSTAHTRSVDLIMGELMATDEERIYVFKKTGVNAARGFPYTKIGWLWLVYGNAGWEVIADHTLTLSGMLAPVDVYTNQLEEQYRGA